MGIMRKKSSAEHVDIHRQLLVLSMILMSSVFAIKIAVYFINEGIRGYLTIAGKSLSIISIILIAITIFWKLRFIPRNERYHLLTTSDSYVNQMMNQACKISWILTLLFLVFATSIINKNSMVLPAKFYLDLSVFLLLATFSISFFILLRMGDNTEHEEEGQ